MQIWPGRSYPLGATYDGAGTNFALFSEIASKVELCLFDATGNEQRFALPEKTGFVWHGYIAGLEPGQRYAYRVHGPWEPEKGLRCNAAKLLLDPYARAIEGHPKWDEAVYPYKLGEGDLVLSGADSAPFMPRCVVTNPYFDWSDDRPPRRPWHETVVYEVHVKGFTQRHPEVPEEQRGKYAGLASPAAIEYLQGLGVTAVELLPIHQFVHSQRLLDSGLRNYWGYDSIGFFAPHNEYSGRGQRGEQVHEFKAMVKALHRAGIEVLLDVVYNHTCEQGASGPTLSWRGLDQAAYYRLDAEGRDVDVTGCGNSLDFSHTRVMQLTLDSLRYWVRECHVDGFRFDLATTLARGRDGRFDPDHPFLVALRTDPVLSRVKLVAEPWDVGPDGWRTGQFPPPLGEWNDRYRDAVRTFWLADSARLLRDEPGHGVREPATRLAGSQDLFGQGSRGPLSSVNYVASHDGFTLADLTTYDHKHNESNGEGNRDGHHDARSWNHGVEGPVDDDAVEGSRHRSMRNLLGTLLLSTGVPMLAAGDEMGRTQRGNNNAYCHDDETTWVDWELAAWQRDLLTTTRYLLRLRRELPTLRSRSFFAGRPVHEDGTTDLAWFDAAGELMTDSAWAAPDRRVLQMFVHGDAARTTPDQDDGETPGDSLLVVLAGTAADTTITLPPAPWGTSYLLLWDSAERVPQEPAAGVDGTQYVRARSLRLYAVDRATATSPTSDTVS